MTNFRFKFTVTLNLNPRPIVSGSERVQLFHTHHEANLIINAHDSASHGMGSKNYSSMYGIVQSIRAYWSSELWSLRRWGYSLWCTLSSHINLSACQPTNFASMDPTYPLVPVANFLACILVLSSMSKSMFQSWNVGACSFAIWVVIMGFTVAVDAIIWADNVENIAPVWCDIGELKLHYFDEWMLTIR